MFPERVLFRKNLNKIYLLKSIGNNGSELYFCADKKMTLRITYFFIEKL